MTAAKQAPVTAQIDDQSIHLSSAEVQLSGW
jgi:hypothetical protein